MCRFLLYLLISQEHWTQGANWIPFGLWEHGDFSLFHQQTHELAHCFTGRKTQTVNTMSGHDDASFFISGKGIMLLLINQAPEGKPCEVTDSREEERQFPLDDSFSMSMGREEEPVQLYPRFDPSFDASDDHLSIQGACTSSSLGSTDRDFLRDSSFPPSIPGVGECSDKRDKPSLCRSMAWSQDSLDERRIIKRCRREEPSPTSLNKAFSFSGYQPSWLQNAASTLTAIHWEEKIVDSMELISFLDHEAEFSNATKIQST